MDEAEAPAERGDDMSSAARATLAALEQGILYADLTGEVQLQNAASERMLGGTAQEITGWLRDGQWQVHDESGQPIDLSDIPLFLTSTTGNAVSDAVVIWGRPDGERITLRVSTEPIYEGGALTGVVTAFVDLTEHRAAERAQAAAEAALAAEQARFTALVERSADIICIVGGDGTIAYSSPAGARLLGYERNSYVGVPFFDLVHPDDRPGLEIVFAELVADPGAIVTHEVRFEASDGSWRHMEMVAANRLDEPAVRGIVANVRDVTERTEAVARLAWQAFHDPLTGLPNRALLMDRLGHAIERARRGDDRTALLFIDLDRFKLVNDTFGHAAGDQVLIEVGRRIMGAVRKGDTVSRHGGDEFMVVAEASSGSTEVMAMAERIRAAIEAPLELPQGQADVSASIGVAFDAGKPPESLLRDADSALYRAKDRGRNRSEIFNEGLRAAALRHIRAEQLVRAAHHAGTLAVYHQPVVDLVSGRVLATEALLRIPGPGGFLESPTEYLAAANESGLIVPIGFDVLARASDALATWRRLQAEGSAPRAPDRVSVNVSARQLVSPTFLDVVRATLERCGLEPSRLVLELSEESIIGADGATTRTVSALEALGVGLAIDDFGTGYSSLSYLKRFPIQWVKLDRSFVSGIGSSRSDTEIVRAVVALGRSLDLLVVAEGIEESHQLALLRELGCRAGQGYLLARPSPVDEVDLADRDVAGLAGS